MTYFWPAWPSSQKSKVLPPVIVPGRSCGGWTAPGGATKRVMLCAGRVVEIVLAETETLLRCVIVLAEVSCHTCALLAARKFERTMFGDIGVRSCLLITMTVRAPSVERIAANVEMLSGFGPVADTLVSPKVDFAPS